MYAIGDSEFIVITFLINFCLMQKVPIKLFSRILRFLYGYCFLSKSTNAELLLFMAL